MLPIAAPMAAPMPAPMAMPTPTLLVHVAFPESSAFIIGKREVLVGRMAGQDVQIEVSAKKLAGVIVGVVGVFALITKVLLYRGARGRFGGAGVDRRSDGAGARRPLMSNSR